MHRPCLPPEERQECRAVCPGPDISIDRPLTLSERRIVINCISCLVHARLARMKERFTLVRRAYPERVSRQTVVARGRWYRRIGRVCLLAAAVAGGVEIFDMLRGVQLPPLTLRSVLDLSPDV